MLEFHCSPWSAPKHEHKTSIFSNSTPKKMGSTKVNHVGNFRHFRYYYSWLSKRKYHPSVCCCTFLTRYAFQLVSLSLASSLMQKFSTLLNSSVAASEIPRNSCKVQFNNCHLKLLLDAKHILLSAAYKKEERCLSIWGSFKSRVVTIICVCCWRPLLVWLSYFSSKKILISQFLES